MIGKYGNDYPLISPHVPPGWTSFIAVVSGNWNRFTVVLGGEDNRGVSNVNIDKEDKEDGIIEEKEEYVTYYIRNESLKFIDKHAEEPFFLYVSHNSPHAPAQPDPIDSDLFPQDKVNEFIVNRPSYKESDLSDKPSYMNC